MEKRPALGKGLSALIPDVTEPSRGPTEVDLDLISPSEHQPRHQVDDTRLDELARSIKANGVIQPIIVRKVEGGYRIIAGERRWRAAQRAGLLRVPVVIKDVGAGNDAQILEMALIENIQREDLNPIDEAAAYEKLSTASNWPWAPASASSAVEEAAKSRWISCRRKSCSGFLRSSRAPKRLRAALTTLSCSSLSLES